MITGAWAEKGKLFLPNYFWRIAFTTEFAFKEGSSGSRAQMVAQAVLVPGITSM